MYIMYTIYTVCISIFYVHITYILRETCWFAKEGICGFECGCGYVKLVSNFQGFSISVVFFRKKKQWFPAVFTMNWFLSNFPLMSMDCHRQDLIFFKTATFPGLRWTKTVWFWLMDFQQSDDFMGLGKTLRNCTGWRHIIMLNLGDLACQFMQLMTYLHETLVKFSMLIYWSTSLFLTYPTYILPYPWLFVSDMTMTITIAHWHCN